MATHGGTHIELDGLVFGYDTGVGIPYYTGYRFYKGRANTNYIAHQNAVSNSSYTPYLGPGDDATWIANHPKAIYAYNAQGGNITGYVNTGVASGNWQPYRHGHWQYDEELGKPVVVMEDTDGQWKAKSFGTGMGSWNSYGKGYGDTYTISWLQWVDNLSKNAKAGLYSRSTAGSNNFHDGQANSSTAYNTKLHTWQRVYQTYTTSTVRDLDSTYLSIYMYGHYNVRATVKIADVQFDWGDYPTAYQDSVPTSSVTSRSTTEGLLDLARNRQIDTANISFNNVGQPYFDGTDDEINTGLTDQLTDFSCVVVFKNDNSEAWGRIVDKAYTNGFFISSYFASSGAGYVGAGIIEPSSPHGQAFQYDTSKYNYFVVTRSGNTHTIYLNGSANSRSKTGSSAALGTAEMAIGAWYGTTNSQRFTGEIPVVKLYNRALTPVEIQQDFNAYKNRFNL